MSVRRTLAAVLAAGVLLAGCSDDPEPRFEPTESPSPSESESSSAEPKAQSPEEFVRLWVTTYNEFEATGEGAELQELSRGCGTCMDIIDVVTRTYNEGGYLKSKGWTLPANLETIYERERAVGFRADVDVAPSRYRRDRSSQVVRSPGATITMEFDVERSGDGWRMFDLTRQAS